MAAPQPSPFVGRLIRLRAVEERDLEWINREYWNPNVGRFMATVWPESMEGTRAWWEAVRGSDPGPFVIETLDGGEPVGVCSLENVSARNRSAVLGIWIAEAHWNRDYGTDAVRTLCGFGFREMNLHRIALSVYGHNPRGRRAYERAGFREEGRRREASFADGRFVDSIEMAILADEFDADESR